MLLQTVPQARYHVTRAEYAGNFFKQSPVHCVISFIMPIFTPYDQIIIVALDSVCWEVLLPLANDGTMPALAAFLKKANYGALESTVPPHTAAAWTTFLTGKDPGHHGVIDFVKFDPIEHRFQFHNSSVVRPESIFTRLSQSGISCGSLFLPRSYPPYPLKNGYMVSGFETPGTQATFTDPEDLRYEVLTISPELHFNFEDDWDREQTDSAFAKNIKRAIASVDVLERLAVHFQRERPVQFQMVYLQATDILFHKAWKWCDAESSKANPVRRELVKNFFRRIDQLLNRVLGLHSSLSGSRRFQAAGAPKTLRLICSDHGHGSSKGRVFINNLLWKWGFLKPLHGLGKISRRIKLLTLSAENRRTRSRELSLDWSQTQAYLAHVGIYGFVYINLKGREAHGSVAAEDFENVRDALIAKFLAEKIPGTQTPLFPSIHKGEQLYARKKELNLPDLVVVPADGFYPRKKLTRGNAIRVTPDSVGGVHRSNGIYAFEGPGIASTPSPGMNANIADIAPTLLLAMGQPIPKSMTGKPLLHLFTDPPVVTFSGEQVTDVRHEDQMSGDVYSKEDEKAIEKRLADLGYLE